MTWMETLQNKASGYYYSWKSNPNQYETAIGPSEPDTELQQVTQGVSTFLSPLRNLFVNQSRVASSSAKDTSGQSTDCSWWNVTCKVSKAASATGDFVSSTLTKVLVLVSVVAVIALFAMAFINKKAEKLA